MNNYKHAPFFVLVGLYMIATNGYLDYPPENLKTVVFKCMPIGWLVFVVFNAEPIYEGVDHFRRNIVAGLAVSMIGDAFLVWRFSLMIPGMIAFSIAHLFYIRALRLRPIGWEAGILFLLSGIVVFNFMVPGIKETEMKYLTFAYTGIVFVMSWRTVVRWQQRPDVGNLFGCFGAVLFSGSDFLIGLDTWRVAVPYASPLIMVSYYLAQLCIAISVTMYGVTGESVLSVTSRQKKQG